MLLDENVTSAISMWYNYGIHGGSFTMAVLHQDFDRAYASAHPMIKDNVQDYISTVLCTVHPDILKDVDGWCGIGKLSAELKIKYDKHWNLGLKLLREVEKL